METYRFAFRVRGYECGALRRVGSAVYQQYLQETAVEASAAFGYPASWYAARGEGWFVRQMSVEYVGAVGVGETVVVETWVSPRGPASARREYRATRDGDGAEVVRASAIWAYVDRATGRPRPIPPELAADIDSRTREVVACESGRPLAPAPAAGTFRWRHQVARYELDAHLHVNNAVYLNWVEEAGHRAAASVGWTFDRLRAADLWLVPTRHDAEFALPARDGDAVEVVSRLAATSREVVGWLHEVRRAPRGELLARCHSTAVYGSAAGEPRLAPAELIDALLQGA